MTNFSYHVTWGIIYIAILALVVLLLTGCAGDGSRASGNSTVFCLVCVGPLDGKQDEEIPADDFIVVPVEPAGL